MVSTTALAGEWVFSQALYGRRFSAWESYEREVLREQAPHRMAQQVSGVEAVSTAAEETPRRRIIMYADFAAFILDQAESDELIGKTVGVYSDEMIEIGGNLDIEAEGALLEAARLEAEADLAADAERAKQNQ